MNKIWLPVIFLLSMLNVHGQEKYSPEALLRDKLHKYCTAVPWEEIYIHSDRSEYIAGEDMWLTVYLFDRQKNRLSQYNSIAYFEILNSNNLQVLKKRISLENGLGPAHVVLPDTLSTGRYLIRAYTNWMKNFLPYNCFITEVNIYNAINDRSAKGIPGKMISGQYNESVSGSASENSGVKMSVDNLKPDKLDIVIDQDKSFFKGNKNNFILLIQTHGEISFERNIKLETQPFQLSIPKEVLLSGINQIVLFDEALNPICERFIYAPMKESELISVSCADSFKTREKVNIEVDPGEPETQSVNRSDVSISVAPGGGIFYPDIDEYLVFGTEFGILPESLRSRHLSDIPPEAVDSFLLNAKSRWINWQAVISGKLPVIRYEREKDSHFLIGRLVNKNTRAAGTNKYLFLSKPDKVATFQYSRTDSNGNFRFSLPVSDKIMDLIIQPEEADVNSSIMILSSSNEDFPQNREESDTNQTALPDYINRWCINYQVNKIYGISRTGEQLRPSLSQPEQKQFYGKPDIGLKMDDYIKLPVMEEVFFELTPGVLLKKKKSTYTMSIFDPVSKKPYDKPPLVFIDGVVIADLAIVAAMDPDNVERIDVIKDLYLVGDYIFFGIVNIITRTGDCRNITLPDYAVRMNYRVVDPVESFLSPDYADDDLKKSRIPDFRNTLYWNPSTSPGKEGYKSIDFWTSDGVGQYEIRLQGIDLMGKPVSFKKVITIR